jgi:hypothetical protein
MYNLICFPHYTCGGLLCDILGNTFSPLGPSGGLNSINHFLGKIGDGPTVYTDYDSVELLSKLALLNQPQGTWVGTHCWPGKLPLDQFGRIILVTTSTYKSKLYRLARAYHHYFQPSWQNLQGIDRLDKMRETAKNYTIPFTPIMAANIENIEFADVVENTAEFKHITAGLDTAPHMDRWQQLNSFLYESAVWTNEVSQALYQAEAEIALNRYYRY